jgi:hypothetical protein
MSARPYIQYWIELTGIALLGLWTFRNPGAFNSMMSALGGTTVNAVRVLQGRSTQ